MATAGQHSGMDVRVPPGAHTIADTLEGGRYHLVLGLSPEANRIVEELALRYGKDKGEIFNIAVGLLKFVSDAARDGNRVVVISRDGEETELAGF